MVFENKTIKHVVKDGNTTRLIAIKRYTTAAKIKASGAIRDAICNTDKNTTYITTTKGI